MVQPDPDLAWKGARSPRPWDEPWPAYLAVQGLLVRNLLAIRRDFPYLFLLTNDTPPDAEVESHMDVTAELYDNAFMERYPPAEVHVNYGRYPPDSFYYGQNVISRLFDVARDDIAYLWPALLNDCYDRLAYQLLFASEHVRNESLVSAMERARTSQEFESHVLDIVDILAYVEEEPNLYLLTKNQSVVTEIEKTGYMDLKAGE